MDWIGLHVEKLTYVQIWCGICILSWQTRHCCGLAVETGCYVSLLLRTFPDLRPIYGWHVTTLWVNCPLWVSQLGQLSLPPHRGR